MKSIITFLLQFIFSVSFAQTFYSLELGSTTQSLNDQRIPGKGGTKFSLTDFSKGPFTSYRVYVGHRWDRHEIRALYAPFSINISGQLKNPTLFKSTLFSVATDTQAYYQFNSYRLTYSYALDIQSDWKYRLGFTGKIRDAEVKLTQGAVSESKKNTGFVPLINFQAQKDLTELYSLQFDLDALGAPQGRAIDLGLFIERNLEAPLSKLFIGYRTVEGGADNDTVYNFAWLHTLTIGIKGQF